MAMKPIREPAEQWSVRLTTSARRRAIARIMDARLPLFACETIPDQVALEKKRLERAPDAELCAALAALPAAPLGRHP